MISIKNLSVTFGGGTPMQTRALNDVSCTIPPGQFVTVIGSNGAGKSTLLNAITGEAPVNPGEIIIGDRTVTRWSPARRAGLVAHVFQDPLAGTAGSLTVEENLALAAQRGEAIPWPLRFAPALSRALRRDCRDRLAALGLGLEERLTEPMGLLSGGQRQAVALTMATMRPSALLLLDEHTASLDPRMAELVLTITRRVIAGQNLTALMVTHSMRQALEMGDRTIMLHEGRIILDVSGEQRRDLKVPDLLRLFARAAGADLDDDALLTG